MSSAKETGRDRMKSTGVLRRRYGGNAVTVVMSGWAESTRGYDMGVAVPNVVGKGGEAAKELKSNCQT